MQAAREANVEITHVIDTHVHADHYSGGRSLAQKVHAPYCLHESNHGQVQYDFLPLQDGQLLMSAMSKSRFCTRQGIRRTACVCWSPTSGAVRLPGSS